MTGLDADRIHAAIGGDAQVRLAALEVFAEIGSTNSYLMRQPGPAPGSMRVAVTDNQTAGRGRHGRTWQSPPGSGLALSIAYTFGVNPDNLPALTLAIGLGAVRVLDELHIPGVQLKWPNDLIAGNGKLGGMLTEAQSQAGEKLTIIAGIGLNIDLGPGLDMSRESGWVQRAVDIRSHCEQLPASEEIAGRLIGAFHRTFVDYEAGGFGPVLRDWQERDWLIGRELKVETAGREVSGIAAGIDEAGALLIDTANQGTVRITSGTVVMVDSGAHVA